MKKPVTILAFVVLVALAVPGWASVVTVTWDAADNFSAISNPNGVWSYGDYGGGGFSGTLNPANFDKLPIGFQGAYGSIEGWEMPGPSDPVVSHNKSLIATVGPDATTAWTQWAPNEVALHPWQGPTVVRFTAPWTGTYNVGATFFDTQTNPPNVAPNAYVYLGGSQEFDETVPTSPLAPLGSGVVPWTPISYSGALIMSAGETLDFVAWGGNNSNATTGFDATITTIVPEPTTLAIWGLGLGVAGAAALRRRKQRGGRWSEENRQAIFQVIGRNR